MSLNPTDSDALKLHSHSSHRKAAADPKNRLPPHDPDAQRIPKNLPGDSNTIFTCPMHPEIRVKGPGTCPKCGMTLEPLIATDANNTELKDMTHRFWIAASFTIPLVILVMGDMLPGQPVSKVISGTTRVWLEMLLATPVCLWSAFPFYTRAIEPVVHKSLNMFTLIGLGVSVAYGYSLIAALAPGIFPDSFRNSAGHVAVYFEATAVHTIAAANVNGAKENNLTLGTTDQFKSVTGKGVQGLISGKRVALGNATLMADVGAEITQIKSKA